MSITISDTTPRVQYTAAGSQTAADLQSAVRPGLIYRLQVLLVRERLFLLMRQILNMNQI